MSESSNYMKECFDQREGMESEKMPVKNEKPFTFHKDTKIITTMNGKYEMPAGGLGPLVYEKMKLHGNSVAQILGDTAEPDTYSDLLKRSVRLAMELKAMGLGRSDIISTCSRHHLNGLVPAIAAVLAGVTLANVDADMSVYDNKVLLDQIQPKVIFVSEAAEELVEKASVDFKTKIVVFGESDRNMKFENLITPKADEDNFKPYYADDVTETAMIFFSSGTTGMPKGILLSHKCLYNQIRDYGEPTKFLIFSSLYWSTTINFSFGMILIGGCRIVPPVFSPQKAWEMIENYNIDFMYMTPIMVARMLAVQPKDQVCKLKALILGGTGVSLEHITKMRTALPQTFVVLTYGQTEIGLGFNPFDPAIKDKPLSAGTPIPGCTYKIVDPESNENLGPNEKGELLIKSDLFMNGYYKRDNTDVLDSEGYLRTGDIAYFDDDLCFYIVDRIKEMFKYNGYHIVPKKLESLLEKHPGVHLATVVGIPNPSTGDEPLGIVIKTEGIDVTEEELIKFVNDKVDDFHKIRAGIRFVDSFPVTATGKIKRRLLRDQFINGEL